MDGPRIDPDLRRSLMRFLYLGSDKAVYFPGYWPLNYLKNLTVIDEILEKYENSTEIVQVIVNTYKEGHFTRYETIVFALCKCILLGSKNVKAACYKAVHEICQTSEELMLFVKHCRFFKTGTGKQWSETIRSWYNSREPLALAKEFVRVKGLRGVRHSTLLKKSHIKVCPADVARDAVIKYAIFGLQRSKELLGEKEGAREIFNYIEIAESLYHCGDSLVASDIIMYYKFHLDQIPTHLLVFPEVWNAILPQMSLSDILNNLSRIYNLGLLASDSSTENMIVNLLTDKDLIKRSKLNPLAVFIIALNNFCKMTVPVIKTKDGRTEKNPYVGLWNWIINKPLSNNIGTAVYRLLNETCLLAPPVGVRYLITMDMRLNMFKDTQFCYPYDSKHGSQNNDYYQAPSIPSGGCRSNDNPYGLDVLAECFYETNVIPGHAAIIIACHLLKRERDVTIAVFTDQGIETIELDRNIDVGEVETILKGVRKGEVRLNAPMKWAIKNKAKVDVFINIVDRTARYMELSENTRGERRPGRYRPRVLRSPSSFENCCPALALEKYRLQCNQPNSKLISISLVSQAIWSIDNSHSGILYIVGIDKDVPKVIDAFAKGKFDEFE